MSKIQDTIPTSLLDANQAVAVTYKADSGKAPYVSAQGDDELAQAIIQLALLHEVPIYENASLVRWLSQLELHEEIPETLYQVMAEILAFVYALEGRSPTGQSSNEGTRPD
ncbi:flagellar protein FhlB [Bacterioplanes sanyensis]|uniref:Flagellar biosynthetic protein FlhB n=1 Tax=Bacterioplanes sanyensis TaxID=1249553 RepID=A0A222FMJ4_9GAMM|nr:EscU/YscU/HrcU family type III secretion system export apparatus switch protein [Bacterioplanes sanyensis]ASP40248.1 flagellar protein FhlB [Bacterioplanes sanyensis]